jgi:hypothetical protein
MLLNCCESEVSTCPTVFWSPLASNWIIGLLALWFDELCILLIKSVVPAESGTIVTVDILYSVIQSNRSRI